MLSALQRWCLLWMTPPRCPSIADSTCCLLPPAQDAQGLPHGCRARRGPWCLACTVLPAHIWARVGSLESVSQGLDPASSCSVCARLQGHPSWCWSCCSLGLCTAPAHHLPNNGFIRAELCSLHCRCFAITPEPGLEVAGGEHWSLGGDFSKALSTPPPTFFSDMVLTTT